MAYSTPWPRVYPGISKLPISEVRRLTIEIPATDANIVMSVAVNNAIFSLICQTAILNAVNYVKSNSLTYANASDLIDFVCQRPDNSTTPETGASDVRSGVEGIHTGATSASHIAASPRKETARGTSREKRKVGNRAKV